MINDECLEMAKPLMEDCKKSIKEVDELLDKNLLL